MISPSDETKRPASKGAGVYVLSGLVFAAVVGAGIFWFITEPQPVSDERLASIEAANADASRGEQIFWAGGCASCHAADGAEGEDRLVLSGGHRLTSDFGTFVVPNISSDPDAGIGNWDIAAFSNAMLAGVRPNGSHL